MSQRTEDPRPANGRTGAWRLSRSDAGDGGRELPPVAERASGRSVRERQREEFGGISLLSTLVGWLAAAGLTAILAGILAAAGTALALNEVGLRPRRRGGRDDRHRGWDRAARRARGRVLLRRLRGRPDGALRRRPPGPRRVAVGIVVAMLVAVLAAIGGAEYNAPYALNCHGCRSTAAR